MTGTARRVKEAVGGDGLGTGAVRYRVARLAKDFDLDLDDPQKRLWLWLRLTTMDLIPRATPPE